MLQHISAVPVLVHVPDLLAELNTAERHPDEWQDQYAEKIVRIIPPSAVKENRGSSNRIDKTPATNRPPAIQAFVSCRSKTYRPVPSESVAPAPAGTQGGLLLPGASMLLCGICSGAALRRLRFFRTSLR